MRDLVKKGEFSRYFSNTLWMLSEKSVVIILGLLSTVFLARFLGPSDFGLFSYGLSILALLSVFVQLGLSGVAVKEYKRNHEVQYDIVSIVFTLKFSAAVISVLIAFSLAITISDSSKEFWVLMILGACTLVLPAEALNLWFQSQVKSKFGSYSYIIGNVFGNSAKILVAILGGSVIYAAIAHAASLLLIAILLLFFYLKETPKKVSLNFKVENSWPIMKQGLLVFIGSLSAVIYLKVDQIMIEIYLGVEQVGIYAVATRISESGYFIPAMIMASLFPKMIEQKDKGARYYKEFLQRSLDVLFWLSFAFIVFLFIFSESLILLLFGSSYAGASQVLVVHAVASIFVFMRVLFNKWVVLEGFYIFSLTTQVIGAISNVLLNGFFIQAHGIVGAAWATLISYSLASYFSLLFFKNGRYIFRLMTRSFFLSWIDLFRGVWLVIKSRFSVIFR